MDWALGGVGRGGWFGGRRWYDCWLDGASGVGRRLGEWRGGSLFFLSCGDWEGSPCPGWGLLARVLDVRCFGGRGFCGVVLV